MTNYRFYLLNRYNNITKVHTAECEGADGIEETAMSLLAENKVAAAIEAWDRDKRVYRFSTN